MNIPDPQHCPQHWHLYVFQEATSRFYADYQRSGGKLDAAAWRKSFWFTSRSVIMRGIQRQSSACMDEWTTKTPNPICRLFFKIDLLTDFAALCLTDFIDWRYIHWWLVFSTQLVNLHPQSREGKSRDSENFSALWLPPWTKELCILVYCCPSIFSLTSELCWRP